MAFPSLDALLIAIVALPFVGSWLAVLFRVNARNAGAYLAGIVALLCLGLTIAAYPQVTGGGVIKLHAPWIPELGLDFTLRMDGFAWVFAALISAIGFLVVLYARYYMSPSDPVPRFFAFLLAFMGAMLGIVLSGNLVQLVFFWELTSLFSFLLIGYWHHARAAREAARMALTITSAGGLCLFAGVLVLGHIAGSYDLDAVIAKNPTIRGHRLYDLALILILLGAFTKSAQFPFHFWLPNAMAAPTPVSAYLHSATMVKAGVFLLVRLWPALGGTEQWLWYVGSAGLVTFILGAFLAIFQQDLKGLLAYSTISHLGLITLLIGLDSPLGQVAAIFHMMNHATFKASLFMAAGIIDHESGTRDIRRLSGLWRFMPITASLAMVAAAAMAGVPLLNGFLSKEMFFAETIEIHDNSLVDRALPYIVTAASMFTVAYSLRFIRDVFFGPPPQGLPRTPCEPPFLMRLPSELLVFACLVVGIAPAFTIAPLLDAAARAVLGSAVPTYSLRLWHGFTPELLMSLVAISGGILVYVSLRSYLMRHDGPPLLRHIKGGRIFEQVMVTLSWRVARQLERFLGTHSLQRQLQILLCAALLVGAAPVYMRGLDVIVPSRTAFDITFVIIWAVGIAFALSIAYQAKYHRLASLVLLGGAGLATCLSFVWISAPDLALTQLAVETVTIVLFLLGLRWLPKRIPMASEIGTSVRTIVRIYRVRDFLIATSAGGGLAALSYAVMTRPASDSVAKYFVEKSYPEGGGANIVNVILVDFRGFDTFGEITVLGIVALSVYALLRRFRPAAESIPVPEQQHNTAVLGSSGTAVTVLMMKFLFPVIMVVALFLLLRGHDAPGGGFVAGIMLALAFIVQYMAHGTVWVEDHLRVQPVRWIGAGLLAAACVGAAAWPFGHPFLTSWFSYVDVPVIGSIPAASALAFDIGIFAVVIGATVLMLIAIAHQTLRRHKAPSGGRPVPAPAPEVIGP